MILCRRGLTSSRDWDRFELDNIDKYDNGDIVLQFIAKMEGSTKGSIVRIIITEEDIVSYFSVSQNPEDLKEEYIKGIIRGMEIAGKSKDDILYTLARQVYNEK